MVYSYTPIYYTSIQDSITSLCKNMLPFSFKKKRLPAIAAAEQRLSKQQADNLKWQQESFHQILKLMGLCKEDLITEQEVSDFRTYLLDTLIASPFDHEHSEILKDKLVFLQELLYSKCISEMEYHAFKRPLLQRLAVQGAEIEARDVIVEDQKKKSDDQEWSAIDLKDDDDKCLIKKESPNVKNNKSKKKTSSTNMKGVAASVLGFASSSSSQKKKGKFKEDESGSGQENNSVSVKNQVEFLTENPFWDNTQLSDKQSETKSVLMQESFPVETKMKVEEEKQSGGDKVKRKPFKTLFQTDKKERQSKNADQQLHGFSPEENVQSGGKLQWGFDGFKKLKKKDEEMTQTPKEKGPTTNTKQIKGKLNHPCDEQSDSFVDNKVLGQNMKKELPHIQADTNSKWTTFDDDDEENCQPKTFATYRNPFIHV